METLTDTNQYRMARRHYHCYGCNDDLVKMIKFDALETEGITCDNCGSNCCVIVDDTALESLNSQVQEENKYEEQTQSLLQTLQQANARQNAPPQVSGVRENINNPQISSDEYGRPIYLASQEEIQQLQRPSNPFAQNSQFIAGLHGGNQPIYMHMQSNNGENQQAQYMHQNVMMINQNNGNGGQTQIRWRVQDPNLNSVQQINMVNGNIVQNNGSQQQFQQHQQQQQQQAQQAAQQQAATQNHLIDVLRQFQFGQMFNDDDLLNMSQSQQFSPENFGMNYNQNFRSSFQQAGPFMYRQDDSGLLQNDPFANLFVQGRVNNPPQAMSFVDFINLVNQRMQQQQEEEARRPTNKNVFARMPRKKIEEQHCKKNDDGTLEMPTCSICMADFTIAETGLFLPCGHIFHPKCIEKWLNDHNTCPVCRIELPDH